MRAYRPGRFLSLILFANALGQYTTFFSCRFLIFQRLLFIYVYVCASERGYLPINVQKRVSGLLMLATGSCELPNVECWEANFCKNSSAPNCCAISLDLVSWSPGHAQAGVQPRRTLNARSSLPDAVSGHGPHNHATETSAAPQTELLLQSFPELKLPAVGRRLDGLLPTLPEAPAPSPRTRLAIGWFWATFELFGRRRIGRGGR